MATPRSCLASLLLGVVVSACGDKEPPPPAPPVLTVSIDNADTVYCTTAAVTVSATVSGGTATAVEVLEDGKSAAFVEAPYQYSFNCAAREERSYAISFRAHIEGNAYDSPAKPIVVDRSRPTVVSGPFLATDTEIAKDAPILVTFSEPMRPVGPNSFSLVTATTAVSWSVDGKVLKIVPQEPITPPQSFVLFLHPEFFLDRAGNPLAPEAPRQWAWTVPALLHTWTLPKYGDGLTALNRPAFARDRAGRSVVASFEYTQASGAADVYVHRSGESGSTLLGGPLSVISGSDSWAEQVQVAVDASDRPVVAWAERISNEAKVFVSRWNGSAWETLANVPNPISSSDAKDLTLAVGNSDEPAVAWTEVDAVQKSRVYVYRWNGSGWNAATPLEASGSTNLIYPSMVIDGEGRPVVAATQQGSSSTSAASVWRLSGAGDWVQLGSSIRPTQASTSATVQRTSLALDAQGKPALAFELSTPGTPASADVYLARYTDPSWAAPQRVDGPDARRPSLGFDAAGAAWVAWEKGDSAANLSVWVRKTSGDVPDTSQAQAFHPLFANGGGGAPVLLIVDQQQKAAQVVLRQ
jgi:hypothetical protein